MKKILVVMYMLVFTFAAAFAQQDKQNHKPFSPEQFKKDMESYIAKEAQLTPAEGQAFFPMMFEMLEKKRKNNDSRRELMRSVNPQTSEAEYAVIIDKVTTLEVDEKKIEKEYYKKFHKVLSYKKIYQVRNAINKFQMEMLRRFTPQRNGRFNHGGWRHNQNPGK